MSYQIFALKWRPQSFAQIVGQNHVVNLLGNSISRGRLAYAYLFAGPRGVGKTSTARILAKSLNCQKGASVTPCQTCSPCQEITNCRSLDVIEIDGASNRGIEEIRVLRESVKFPPSVGRFKIYIIDEVHMLTNEAFNALLKTLEEPPKFVKFIFATTQVAKIPATILSRCQRLDFRRIPVLDIINQLKMISEKEKINLEDEVLFCLARACDGSLRDAESMLDQLASFSQEGLISISDVSSLLGVLEQQMLFDITDKIINKDAPGVLRLLNDMLRQGKDNKIILSNIIEHFRNLIVAKISQADPYLIDLPSEIAQKLLSQSQYFSLEEAFNIFNILVNTQQMSKRMDSSIIPLEISLVRLTQEKKGTVAVRGNNQKQPAEQNIPRKNENKPDTKGKVQDNKAGIEKKAHDNKPQLKEVKQDNNPDSKQIDESAKDTSIALGQSHLKEIWPKIIDNLSKIKMSVATFLSEGVPLELENNILTISFPNNCSLHRDTLEKKENKLLVEKIFSDILQVKLRTKFVLSLKAKSAQENTGQKGEADPFIHSALDTFNARLI